VAVALSLGESGNNIKIESPQHEDPNFEQSILGYYMFLIPISKPGYTPKNCKNNSFTNILVIKNFACRCQVCHIPEINAGTAAMLLQVLTHVQFIPVDSQNSSVARVVNRGLS
jgi:hypothetical protein